MTALEDGWENFRSLNLQANWELFWYQKAAEMRNDMKAVAAAKKERQSRQVVDTCKTDERYGVLPDLMAA